jgi:hypothetical protein
LLTCKARWLTPDFTRGESDIAAILLFVAWHESCEGIKQLRKRRRHGTEQGEQGMEIVIESYAAIGVASGAAGALGQVWLPPGYTLTGGGAYDLGRSTTNMLTSCYPLRNQDGVYNGWAAAGADPLPLAVYAIGIKVTRGGMPVRVEQNVFCASSALVGEPGVSARLGAGWIGTGGGAMDNRAGNAGANVLTSSYPLIGADGKIVGWSASGKDPSEAELARVTAFVIGIRGADGVALDAHIVSNSSMMTGFPSAMVVAPRTDAVVAGGGALRSGQEHGQMLSASCPVISSRDGRLTGWYAARKVMRATAPGTITAYSVMLKAA